MLNRELSKIDFIQYLTRPYDMLTIFAHATSFKDKLEKSLGFSFKYFGYLSADGVVSILRVENEMKRLMDLLNGLIVNNPSKFLSILDLGQKFNRILRKRTSDDKIICKRYSRWNDDQLLQEFNHLFDLYASQFVFTTIIPYRAGVLLDRLVKAHPLPQYQKMLSLVEKLRMVVAYIPFEKIVFDSLFREVGRRHSIKNHNLFYNLTPQEIRNLIIRKEQAIDFKHIEQQRCFFLLF